MPTVSPSKSAELFRAALKRKQGVNPAYSLRALARDWGVSAAFLSKVMKGEKLPPRERLERLCALLELDVLEKETVIRDLLVDPLTERLLPIKDEPEKTHRKTTKALARPILSSWMNLAVLEGLTLEPPHNEVTALTQRLGLTEPQMRRTIQILADNGLIEEVDGRWQKADRFLYVAAGRSRSEIRAFHEMMIEKARQELLTRTNDEDYQRRMINGFTIAVNPDQIDRLKAMIVNFMDDLNREAVAGESLDVYQCNIQFFPLTRKLDRPERKK